MHYKRNLLEELESRYSTLLASHNGDVAKARWKRDLSQRVNGSTDPWYKCDLWQLMIDYTRNYTFPWSEVSNTKYLPYPQILTIGNLQLSMKLTKDLMLADFHLLPLRCPLD